MGRRSAFQARWALGGLLLVYSLLGFGGIAHAGAGGMLPTAVGIRATVSNTDLSTLSADIDVTAYTRSIGPYGTIGYPFIGLPAIDYGDGATVPVATLGLASPAGGPGGSNVWRSLASFTHSYPNYGNYTATVGMACVACFRTSYVFFPPGSPVPPTFTQTFNLIPATVIGNLAATYFYSGTTYSPFLSASVRYAATLYDAVTNTVGVSLPFPFGPAVPVPALSTLALGVLGGLMLLRGLVLLRRRPV